MSHFQYQTVPPAPTPTVTKSSGGNLSASKAGTWYFGLILRGWGGFTPVSSAVSVTVAEGEYITVTIPSVIRVNGFKTFECLVVASTSSDLSLGKVAAVFYAINPVTQQDEAIAPIIISEDAHLTWETISDPNNLPSGDDLILGMRRNCNYLEGDAIISEIREYKPVAVFVDDEWIVQYRWIKVNPQSYLPWVSSRTGLYGCDREILLIEDANIIQSPDYGGNTESQPVGFILYNNTSAPILRSKGLLLAFKFNGVEVSNALIGFAEIRILGYIKLSDQSLDTTSLTVGEWITYLGTRSIYQLEKDLPDTQGLLLEVRLNIDESALPPEARPIHGMQIQVSASFSPRNSEYFPDGGLLGNYISYGRKVLPNGLSLGAIAQAGQGKIGNYVFSSTLPQQTISTLQPNTANQKIAISSNGVVFPTDTVPLTGARLAIASTVDSVGQAYPTDSWLSVAVDNTKLIQVTLTNPTRIRTDYPDIIAEEIASLNAIRLVVYVKGENGANIYKREVAIARDTEATEVFLIGNETGTNIGTSLPVVANEVGLFEPSVVVEAIAGTSLLPTAILEIKYAYIYEDTITTIDHTPSETKSEAIYFLENTNLPEAIVNSGYYKLIQNQGVSVNQRGILDISDPLIEFEDDLEEDTTRISLRRAYFQSTAPTVDDDSSAGYRLGDRWFDTSDNNQEYALVDTAVGAAEWKTVGSGIDLTENVVWYAAPTSQGAGDGLTEANAMAFGDLLIKINNTVDNGYSITIIFLDGIYTTNDIWFQFKNKFNIIIDKILGSSPIFAKNLNFYNCNYIEISTEIEIQQSLYFYSCNDVYIYAGKFTNTTIGCITSFNTYIYLLGIFNLSGSSKYSFATLSDNSRLEIDDTTFNVISGTCSWTDSFIKINKGCSLQVSGTISSTGTFTGKKYTILDNGYLKGDTTNIPASLAGTVENKLGLSTQTINDLAFLDTVNTTQIDNNAVTLAKLQDSTSASIILGRGSSGTGDYQELSLGSNISITGTTVNVSSGTATIGDGDYGDVVVSSSGTVWTIENVVSKLLTGFTEAVSTGALLATDTILESFGKIQKYLTDYLTSFNTANKLVQLDGTGKLPAIDGSQLTGISGGGGREELTSDRTYYVRTDGNDSNDGLTNTIGGAFLTIKKAIDVIASLDLSIYILTIKVGNGTYTLTTSININNNFIGGTILKIEGDKTTPTNVVITSANDISYFEVSANLPVYIEGFHFTNTGNNSGTVFLKSSGGHIYHGFNDYGQCSSGSASNQYHLFAGIGGKISMTGSYAISGGNAYGHMGAIFGFFVYGIGSIPSVTVTITNTPSFNKFIYLSRLSMYGIYYTYVVFSGAATGTRYEIDSNSVIQTVGGASYFPGNASGVTATGGQYI